jgi:hypothetical protein
MVRGIAGEGQTAMAVREPLRHWKDGTGGAVLLLVGLGLTNIGQEPQISSSKAGEVLARLQQA